MAAAPSFRSEPSTRLSLSYGGPSGRAGATKPRNTRLTTPRYEGKIIETMRRFADFLPKQPKSSIRSTFLCSSLNNRGPGTRPGALALLSHPIPVFARESHGGNSFPVLTTRAEVQDDASRRIFEVFFVTSEVASRLGALAAMARAGPVSYTHLTLPTIYSV